MREKRMFVKLIAKPDIDWIALGAWMHEVEGQEWLDRVSVDEPNDGQLLIEAAGRRCYKSFAPKINPNVSRVRTDSREYLQNGIIGVDHGSVLEHAQYTFALENVSRVLTHELVRHRVGVAISQESLRYVRLDDIPFWWPDWAKEDPELYQRGQEVIAILEDFQVWQAEHFKLDDEGVPFAEKKAKTSFMRRFAPEGLTTGMVWSANVRALRHVIKMRTDSGAEEEIRIFGEQIRDIMLAEAPYLFEDMIPEDPEFKAELIKAMTEPIDPTTPPTSVIT